MLLQNELSNKILEYGYESVITTLKEMVKMSGPFEQKLINCFINYINTILDPSPININEIIYKYSVVFYELKFFVVTAMENEYSETLQFIADFVSLHLPQRLLKLA